MRSSARRLMVGLVACCVSVSVSGCLVRGSLAHEAAAWSGLREGEDYYLFAAGENSYVDLANLYIGTVILGGLEGPLLTSEEEIERSGFRVEGGFNLGEGDTLFAGYRRAEGDARVSGSVSEGGSSDHGITFFDVFTYTTPYGSGSSTGYFLGNSYGLGGEIFTENAWSQFNFGYARTQDVGETGTIRARASFHYEDIRTEHSADLYAAINGVPYGDIWQMTYVKTYDQYYGIQLEADYSWECRLVPDAIVTVGGFTDIVSRNGNGRADQINMCGLCGSMSPVFQVNQNLNVEDDDWTLSGGLRASVSYPVTERFDVAIGYEKSWLGQAVQFDAPATPADQPAFFTSGEIERDFFWLGARVRFQ